MGKIIDFLYKLVDKMNGTDPVIPKKEETLVEFCDNQKQLKLDKRYLRMAYIWAENSYAKRRQVGCLIVKDKMIISDGYNGSPSGFPNVCEGEDGKTLPYVLHAEANAVSKLAKSSNNCKGATLYCTDMPCLECAKLIIQAEIKRVVYCRDYHTTDGLELLKRANIEVVQIMESELGDNKPLPFDFLFYEENKEDYMVISEDGKKVIDIEVSKADSDVMFVTFEDEYRLYGFNYRHLYMIKKGMPHDSRYKPLFLVKKYRLR